MRTPQSNLATLADTRHVKEKPRTERRQPPPASSEDTIDHPITVQRIADQIREVIPSEGWDAFIDSLGSHLPSDWRDAVLIELHRT